MFSSLRWQHSMRPPIRHFDTGTEFGPVAPYLELSLQRLLLRIMRQKSVTPDEPVGITIVEQFSSFTWLEMTIACPWRSPRLGPHLLQHAQG